LFAGRRQQRQLKELLKIARQEPAPLGQVAGSPLAAMNPFLDAPDVAAEDTSGVCGRVLGLQWQTPSAEHFAQVGVELQVFCSEAAVIPGSRLAAVTSIVHVSSLDIAQEEWDHGPRRLSGG
jgi:hypothetical protein